MENEFSIGIVARLKHGDFLEALEHRGWTQHEGAQFLGMSDQAFGKLINMKWVPKRISDKFERKLFELTGKLPDDLWPDRVFTKEFIAAPKSIKVIKKIPEQALVGMGLLQLPPVTPDDVLNSEGLKAKMKQVLETLTPREERVIKMLFYEGKSNEEIAQEFAVDSLRIKQIIAKAIRKLRHPSRMGMVQDFIR